MRETAEKRHNDWVKAIRKRNLYPDYYDNLHQFSKNKIHCSCPMCRAYNKYLADKKVKIDKQHCIDLLFDYYDDIQG